MADQPDLNKLPGGPQEAPDEPPKKSCLNTQPSTTAVQDMALTPGDDGNDFYNTPVTAGIPIHTNTFGAVTSTDHSEPATPPTSTAVITGLSLCNNSIQAPEPIDGGSSAPNGTKNEAISANDEQMTGTEPHPHGETDETNQGAETIKTKEQGDALESGDAMMTDEAVSTNSNKVDSENAAPNGGDSRNDQDTDQTEDSTSEDSSEDDEEEDEDEHPEWETDSSPIQSSSELDDSDEDEGDYPLLSAEETARILMQAEAGSDDEADGKMDPSGAHVRTANELPEEALPIPDITVTPDMKIVLLGHVETIVENVVLIKATTSGEYQVLETNSVLCLEGRTVIGVVADTLGRVEEPLYIIRFQDPAKISEFGLSPGKPIFYVESHSTFVFTQPLKGMKGSDASNFHDEEVGEDEIEFSDDEAEAEYKRKLKQKRKEKKDAAKGEPSGFGRSKKEPPGPSKLRQTELNYDDEDGAGEDGYTPLARPQNYHEMVGNQEAPIEGVPYSDRGSRGGRGRGFDRGSGRGRGGGGGRGNRGGSWGSDHHRHHHLQDSNRQSNYPPGREGSSQGSPVNQQQPPAQPSQPAASYQGQQPFAYNAANVPTQQFTPYAFYPQQQQQQPQPYGQLPVSMPQFPQLSQFPIQMPFQPNPYAQIPAGAHINPAFLAALQQQQQQQQQNQAASAAAAAAAATQGQNPPTSGNVFDQVKAQLDILRQLSGGGAPPPQQGGSGQ